MVHLFRFWQHQKPLSELMFSSVHADMERNQIWTGKRKEIVLDNFHVNVLTVLQIIWPTLWSWRKCNEKLSGHTYTKSQQENYKSNLRDSEEHANWQEKLSFEKEVLANTNLCTDWVTNLDIAHDYRIRATHHETNFTRSKSDKTWWRYHQPNLKCKCCRWDQEEEPEAEAGGTDSCIMIHCHIAGFHSVHLCDYNTGQPFVWLTQTK